MNKVRFILALFTISISNVGFNQVNNNCSAATNLTSNGAPLCNETTDGGNTQAGEVTASGNVCASANFNTSVWYSFTATSSDMFVQWEFTGISGGATWCPSRLSMVVYNTGTCMPTSGQIASCEANAADGAIVLDLTNLIIGNSYLVQVGYNDGTGCKNPIFCMSVGDTSTPCNCNDVCTNGCGFATTPSVATVTANCPEYELIPVADGGETDTYCYDFVAINTTVSWSMIVTSNCGGGNVTNFSWTLQTDACGANVATGTLANMSSTGLTIGQTYVLCYTYTVPTSCNHSSYYPYFVGATTPLPVELIEFSVRKDGKVNTISWETLSEKSNDFFQLERLNTSGEFEIIGIKHGAGNSQERIQYSMEDRSFIDQINYYRLTQVDYDGNRNYSTIISVDNSSSPSVLLRSINLLGQEVDEFYNGIVLDIYSNGEQIKRVQ